RAMTTWSIRPVVTQRDALNRFREGAGSAGVPVAAGTRGSLGSADRRWGPPTPALTGTVLPPPAVLMPPILSSRIVEQAAVQDTRPRSGIPGQAGYRQDLGAACESGGPGSSTLSVP